MEVTHTPGLLSSFDNEDPITEPGILSLQPKSKHQQASISSKKLTPEKLLGKKELTIRPELTGETLKV